MLLLLPIYLSARYVGRVFQNQVRLVLHHNTGGDLDGRHPAGARLGRSPVVPVLRAHEGLGPERQGVLPQGQVELPPDEQVADVAGARQGSVLPHPPDPGVVGHEGHSDVLPPEPDREVELHRELVRVRLPLEVMVPEVVDGEGDLYPLAEGHHGDEGRLDTARGELLGRVEHGRAPQGDVQVDRVVQPPAGLHLHPGAEEHVVSLGPAGELEEGLAADAQRPPDVVDPLDPELRGLVRVGRAEEREVGVGRHPGAAAVSVEDQAALGVPQVEAGVLAGDVLRPDGRRGQEGKAKGNQCDQSGAGHLLVSLSNRFIRYLIFPGKLPPTLVHGNFPGKISHLNC